MARTVYIVQQINWNYNDEFNYPESDTPLKAFLSRTAAEAYQRELESQTRHEFETLSPEDVQSWSRNLAATFGW